MDLFFQIANLWVLPFWIIMIGFPKAILTKKIIRSYWILTPLPIFYTGMMLVFGREIFSALNPPQLTGIQQALSQPVGAIIAWVHFLAFDLFVGRWVYLDSRKRAINVWVMAPVLLGVFMAGPFGLLLYLMFRRRYKEVDHEIESI